MKLEVLNGSGFSRVKPGGEPTTTLNGFSRVSSDGTQLSGRKERKARREERRERRQEKRETRQEKRQQRPGKQRRTARKSQRQAAREARISKRTRRREARTQRAEARAAGQGFGSKLIRAAEKVFDKARPELIENIIPEQYQDLAYNLTDQGVAPEQAAEEVLAAMDQDGYNIDEGGEPGETKGLFKKKSWWEKRSKGEKALMIGGGILVLDALVAGPISTTLGYRKKKKKR